MESDLNAVDIIAQPKPCLTFVGVLRGIFSSFEPLKRLGTLRELAL